MPRIIILNKMDKKNVPQNTITRDVKYLAAPTGNIYETVVILYKRANQIALAEKKELNKKLEDFKNDPILWTRFSRIVSRLRFRNIMRDSLNLFS